MKLFEPTSFGALRLSNRVVMAPLTRTRAGEHGIPNDLLVEHYRQRAGLGMIITEGTWPVQEGRSYPGQPGIETDEQIAGWRRVADAVHAEGGTIVMQLMHGGRVSHPDISQTPRIVAPSAIAAPGQTHTATGKADMPVPHELTTAEVQDAVQGFAQAARNAIAAGLDGVEVHGANGYLVHEFMSPVSNTRTDQYGGSPRTAPASRSRSRPPSPKPSARSAPASACRPSTASRASSRTTRPTSTRPTRRSPRASPRSDSRSSTSCTPSRPATSCSTSVAPRAHRSSSTRASAR